MKTAFMMAVVLASLAGLRGVADIESAISSEKVFERHFRAVGGVDALEKIDSLIIEGAGQEGQHSFEFELRIKSPGLILFIARTGRGFEVRQGRDSEARCWRKDPDGLFELDPKFAAALMNLAIAFHPPSQIALSRRLVGTLCENETENGRSFIAVGGSSENSMFPRFVFEEQSGVLSRIDELRIEQYASFEALRFPSVVHPNANTVFRIRNIRVNPVMEVADFDRPPGPLPSAGEMRKSAMPKYATQLSSPGKIEIVRRPGPADFGRGKLAELPRFNPSSGKHWQVDVRSADLSHLDLSCRAADLLHADFDSRTRWPEKLPAEFDPARVMELGKDPGLGVRKLHARGITGKGIAIGIIDQTLLVDHEEYAGRIRLYEEIHAPAGLTSEMHGPAVASIAAGSTVGVAPEADLYYIAETHGTFGPDRKFDWDFCWLAKSIERLLDVNAMLPAGGKIRVISISVGWSPNQKGYSETMAAVERASKEDVFVISTAIEATHNLAFHGLGREALCDPNNFDSFGPGSWWAQMFWKQPGQFAAVQRLLVPMDSRATASPTGLEDCVFYSSGGWSWCVPWLAGLYALACQVDPAVTPERFWAEALQTGRKTRINHNSKQYDLGTLADPVALIERLAQTRSNLHAPRSTNSK
jgi:hypothetical protein